MSVKPGTLAFAVYATAFVFCCLVYLETSRAIVNEWVYNGPYTHGLLALCLSFVIVWQKKSDLKFTPAIIWLPAAGLLLSSLLWFAGHISHTFLFTAVGMFGVLVNSCWLLFGFRGLLVLASTLSCILLVLPIWGMFQWPLQLISIYVTDVVLNLLAIPTLQQGIYFTVPGGKFAVEPGCSGLGFLLCSILLAIVYAHFNQHSPMKTARLIAFAIALALISNWIRIVTIILVGNATNMEHAIVQDHLTFGWIVFAIALIPFYWLANRGEVAKPRSAAEEQALPWLAQVRWPPVATVLLLLALVPATTVYLSHRNATHTQDSRWIVEAFEAELGQGLDYGAIRLEPAYFGASDISQHHYRLNDQPLTLLVIRYDEQDQGQELIFIENSLFNKDRWQVNQEIRHESLDVNHLYLTDSRSTQRQVFTWYVIGPYATSSKLLAKAYEVLAYFLGQTTAYQIALVMDSPDPSTQQQLQNLIAKTLPEMRQS